MTQNPKLLRPDTTSQASNFGFRGHVLRRNGDMRSVSLGGRVVNTDHIFGLAREVEGSFEETFSKTANDIDLEADEEMSDPDNNVVSAFSRIKKIFRDEPPAPPGFKGISS